MTVLADDNVIVHGNPQRLRDIDGRPDHLDVGDGVGSPQERLREVSV
jgi:hypothetical protein